jgi:hypothetical protein
MFGGVSEVEPYALIATWSDIVDFLKSSESNPVILIFDSYRGRDRV